MRPIRHAVFTRPPIEEPDADRFPVRYRPRWEHAATLAWLDDLSQKGWEVVCTIGDDQVLCRRTVEAAHPYR